MVHIEDEPETVYAQLVAEGIYPGMQVRVIEVSPHRIRFLAGGEEHVLAPIFAANLSVTPVSNGNIEAEPAETLLSLNQGEMGEVLEISRRVRGPERRRLMDMGILPGTKVGLIGKAKFNTELHEQRDLLPMDPSTNPRPDNLPPIPFKLTLSEAEGNWINDKKHGHQFKASELRIVPPSTIEGMEKYLGSGMIRGIGPHFAKKLVKAFGEKVFDVIEKNPDRL